MVSLLEGEGYEWVIKAPSGVRDRTGPEPAWPHWATVDPMPADNNGEQRSAIVTGHRPYPASFAGRLTQGTMALRRPSPRPGVGTRAGTKHRYSDIGGYHWSGCGRDRSQ